MKVKNIVKIMNSVWKTARLSKRQAAGLMKKLVKAQNGVLTYSQGVSLWTFADRTDNLDLCYEMVFRTRPAEWRPQPVHAGESPCMGVDIFK